MALNDRLRQVSKIGLAVATMATGHMGIPQDQFSQMEKNAQVQQVFPQDYSDLLSGGNEEKVQPYLDLMRETKTGRELLDSMRQNGVRLSYMKPFITDTGAIYLGGVCAK